MNKISYSHYLMNKIGLKERERLCRLYLHRSEKI